MQDTKDSLIEKSTGKENKITIVNDKSRLSKEQVEKMANDAELYAKDDQEFRKKIEAKNSLEQYCFFLKEKAETSSDKSLVLKNVEECLKWLEENNNETEDAILEKKKHLENVCAPYISDKSENATTSSAPRVEEVD